MPNDTIKLIRLRELVALIKLGRSTVYDKLNVNSPRHDAAFPRPVRLGASAIAWRESDIEAWIDSRAQAAKS